MLDAQPAGKSLQRVPQSEVYDGNTKGPSEHFKENGAKGPTAPGLLAVALPAASQRAHPLAWALHLGGWRVRNKDLMEVTAMQTTDFPRKSASNSRPMSGQTSASTVKHCFSLVWFGLIAGFVGLASSSCSETPSQGADSSNEILATNRKAAGGTGDSTWDVNDISILYPLKSHGSGEPGKLIRIDEGAGLVSQEQFGNMLELLRRDFKLDYRSGGQARLMNERSKWAVTGLRIHSCMQRKAKDPCLETVNVIVQPIIGDESSTAEFTMHLVYVTGKSSVDLLRDMIRIRENTAGAEGAAAVIGAPMGVHPILDRPGGLASPFALALRDEFILKHLSPQKLVGMAAIFVEPDRLQPWVFLTADARNMSKVKNSSIFVFDPATSVNDCGVPLPKARQICRRDIASGQILDSEEKQAQSPAGSLNIGLTPAGIPFVDNFLTLALRETSRSFDSIQSHLPMWQDVFNRIENPRVIGSEETNCASCHRTHTDRIRFRNVFKLEPTGPNAFVVNAASGCTPGTSIDENRGIKTFNVRNFGYLHHDAIVSRRVQNETLHVCEMLKDKIR